MLVDNHTYIRHIMLYHFEKGWKAAQSFRDLNELFGERTIRESRCREWFARFKSGDTSLEDIARKRSTIGFRQPGTFSSRGRGQTLDNSNAGRQFQCGPFNHRSSSQKAWKGMEISSMSPSRTHRQQ